MDDQQKQAEQLAIQALAFIAGDEERIGRFLALCGVDADEIRPRMKDPAFQGGVLDYLLQFEPDLLEFADWAGIDPALPIKMRQFLPGALRDDYS